MTERGDVIEGRYVLGDVLGSGGMGIVYSADQRRLQRTVAIKLPHAELARDPTVHRRFGVEAIAGSRIDHPNVVRVLDYGASRGAPYLVMERLIARSLGAVLVEDGPVSIALALELVEQILAGLASAHAAGIVHGDVKSDNVLVSGRVHDGALQSKIIDFGLARFVDEPPCNTPHDERLVSGTPEYIAPELFRGAPSTFASDVYGAGIILYELVAGTTPFAGGTPAEIMERQLAVPAVPVSLRRPGAPGALDDLVARALAKEARDRYRDAAAFRSAVAELRLASAGHADEVDPPAPIVFSCEATTLSMGTDPASRTRASASSVRRATVDERRSAVVCALATRDDQDGIVVAYLELARALIDEHALRAAITELEHGIQTLSETRVSISCAPLWRLQLSLAALYDGTGDRRRACVAARSAHASATLAASHVGQSRATQLLRRLIHPSPRARPA